MDEDGVEGREQEPEKQEPEKQETGGANTPELAQGGITWGRSLLDSDPLIGSKFDERMAALLKVRDDALGPLSSLSTSWRSDSPWYQPPVRGEATNERDNSYERLEKKVDLNAAEASAHTEDVDRRVRQVNDLLASLKDQVEGVSASSSTLVKDVSESQRLLRAYKHTMEKAEKSLATAERRSVELVGLVSSIIALILVSATSALSQRHPITVFLVILLLAACLMLFACMLHVFFQPEEKRGRATYWTPFFVVPVAMIIVVGLVLFILTITGWLGVVS